MSLHVDKRDRLWVSTLAGLVVKEGAQWRPLGTNEGWAGNQVRTFAERVNGDQDFCWMPSNHGVIRLTEALALAVENP